MFVIMAVRECDLHVLGLILKTRPQNLSDVVENELKMAI